jgi:hypothetical protein
MYEGIMRKERIFLEDRPKTILESMWYIVRYNDILKPKLLWQVFESKREAQVILDNNRSRIKFKNYEVIYGKVAKKYDLKFVTLSALRDNTEHSPYLVKIKYRYPKRLKTKWLRKLFREKCRRYKEKNKKNYLSKQITL